MLHTNAVIELKGNFFSSLIQEASRTLSSICVQLQKDMCATLCAQTPAAGVPVLTSVLLVGTTADMAHVWEAATFYLGQRF